MIPLMNIGNLVLAGATAGQSPFPWVIAGSLAHLIGFGWVMLHCLRFRRPATSAILWIFVAWSFPVMGWLLYLALGVDRVRIKGFRKHVTDQRLLQERHAREEEALPLVYWHRVHQIAKTIPEDHLGAALERAMNLTTNDYPLLSGNRITPLITGDQAYPAMLEAIRSAENHIHLQSFIIARDDTGRRFLDALAERAREGITVRVLYDRFGCSRSMWPGLFRDYANVPNMRVVGWTQANPLKRQFQINLRNHRKLLIVDGRQAFCGGINLRNCNVSDRGSQAIRNYHFAAKGPIVQELQYAFMRDWYFMTEEDPDMIFTENHFPPVPLAGRTLARVLNGGPNLSEREVITTTFMMAFTAARKSIYLCTPYFVPTVDILQALRMAAIRGVAVHVVVPRDCDHVFAGLASQALYEDLLVVGVRIFRRRPPFLHAKALIVDGTFALVGTANLDVRSLRLNYETCLAVHDETFVNSLKAVILEEIANSDEIVLEDWCERSTGRRIAENFCSLLEPVL